MTELPQIDGRKRPEQRCARWRSGLAQPARAGDRQRDVSGTGDGCVGCHSISGGRMIRPADHPPLPTDDRNAADDPRTPDAPTPAACGVTRRIPQRSPRGRDSADRVAADPARDMHRTRPAGRQTPISKWDPCGLAARSDSRRASHRSMIGCGRDRVHGSCATATPRSPRDRLHGAEGATASSPPRSIRNTARQRRPPRMTRWTRCCRYARPTDPAHAATVLRRSARPWPITSNLQHATRRSTSRPSGCYSASTGCPNVRYTSVTRTTVTAGRPRG